MTETPRPPVLKERKGPTCINCGVDDDGGYEVEDGPGPFCSLCWDDLERHFATALQEARAARDALRARLQYLAGMVSSEGEWLVDVEVDLKTALMSGIAGRQPT
jgi:hypothetical protein